MKSVLSVFVVSAVTVFSSFSNATTLEEDFNSLKDEGIYFGVSGTICEEVARLELVQAYPEPQYHVVTGIAYMNGHKTIGELDVIVFENRTQDAIKVAEVKCWQDMDGGLKKARDQRQRFLKNIQKGGIDLRSTKDKRAYSAKQFRGVKDFETIGQKGSKAHGYDRELDHELQDLWDLRSRLMACQGTGECKRP